MGGIWTVARETFKQCLRTKVAIVFAVLLVACLAALPSAMEGDGTLAGRIRTFLDYAKSATCVLLSLVVVLLSIGVVTGDVERRYAFVVFSKPVARWQYVLGRWLGVLLLGAVLLAGAGGAIYGLARYLRGRDDLVLRPEDRRAVETEVFVAREQVFPEPRDVAAVVAKRVRLHRENGTWDTLVQTYADKYELNLIQAAERVVADMRKDEATRAQSVPAGKSQTWTFRNVHPQGEAITVQGTVRAVSREAGAVTVSVPAELTGRLVIMGPVEVAGVTGRVAAIWKTRFRAVFHLEDMRSERLRTLKPGAGVRVVLRPTVQVSYKLSPARRDLVEPLRAAWAVRNPQTGFVYQIPPIEAPQNTRSTLVVPGEAIDANGTLRLRYVNYSPTSVTALDDDVSVYYAVGSFEANFAKAFLLVLMGLAFLAALGVFAGCWLSFPVACLLCLVMLGVGAGLHFLTEAVEMGLQYGSEPGLKWTYHVARYMLVGVKVVLPDLSATLGTEFLVEGVAVPGGYLGEAALLTVVLRAAILLALACWIFTRKELARVQVS